MTAPAVRIWRAGYTILVSPGWRRGHSPDAAYVEVRRKDGAGWGARLHTPESVREILDGWRRKGEHSGLYFWAPDVVIVREITREAIVALVEDLMAEGELELAFVPIQDEGGAALGLA